MNKELDDKFCQDFPQLFADRHAPMHTTCMCWGFDCGDGWYDIIYSLSSDLTKIINALPDYYTCECGHEICDHVNLDMRRGCEGKDCECELYVPRGSLFKASQVKEKFGTLRFYMTYEDAEMSARIQEAEAASGRTCEQCGKPGQRCSVTGWIQTLCPECYQEDIDEAKSRKYFEEGQAWYGNDKKSCPGN